MSLTVRRPSLLNLIAWGSVGCALSVPASVAAFSAAETYRYPAAAAGGGNRYFTGSPSDGYTCKVCHSGGASTVLEVSGLPLTSYQPNTRYEIVLDWPDALENVSAAIEITDQQGQRAGELMLAPESEIEEPEYCAPAVNEIPAASITLVPPDTKLAKFGYCSDPEQLPADCRQVIGVPDCGAKRLRFAWRAPETDVGPLWFAGSSVRSNQDGDISGDGVTDLSRVMGSPAARNPYATTTAAGCSVTRGHRTRVSSLWLGIIGLGWVIRRSLGRRTRQPLALIVR